MPTRRKDGSLQSGPRPFEDITHISVHHTAVEGGTPTGHANYHVRKGDAGIAYHVYVRGDQIYQLNDLLALTWHTESNNHHTVGISVEGDFTRRDLTEVERMNLYAAIITVMSVFNVPISHVMGHKEYPKTATSCPGFNMEKVRADVAAIIEQMQYNESPSKQREEIFSSVTRVNDLYAKFLNKEGKYSEAIQREAERKLTVLYPALKENGFI